MITDKDQDDIKSRLAGLKVDPPEPDAFETSLRRALAEEGLKAMPPSVGWQAWVKAHPLFSGASMGLLTALVVLYVGLPQQSTTSIPPIQKSAIAGLTMNPSSGQEASHDTAAATHRVPNKGVALIKFHFSSEVAVADVDMQIELPPGLKFWSKGQELEQNAVAWRGGLKAGENTFPVAIFAGQKGTYQVIATAEVDGQRIQHEVRIEVIEDA